MIISFKSIAVFPEYMPLASKLPIFFCLPRNRHRYFLNNVEARCVECLRTILAVFKRAGLLHLGDACFSVSQEYFWWENVLMRLWSVCVFSTSTEKTTIRLFLANVTVVKVIENHMQSAICKVFSDVKTYCVNCIYVLYLECYSYNYSFILKKYPS